MAVSKQSLTVFKRTQISFFPCKLTIRVEISWYFEWIAKMLDCTPRFSNIVYLMEIGPERSDYFESHTAFIFAYKLIIS